jgi:hypothetical protein
MSYANDENLIAACAAGKHDEAYVLLHDDGAAIYSERGHLITTLDEDTALALRWMHPQSARLMVLAIYRAAIEGEQRAQRMGRAA